MHRTTTYVDKIGGPTFNTPLWLKMTSMTETVEGELAWALLWCNDKSVAAALRKLYCYISCSIRFWLSVS